MSYIHRILNFRKPSAVHLDYIDIVIQQKIIVLISWEFKYRYKIKILPPHKSFTSYSGSVIVNVPESTQIIKISISSIWRRATFKIPLKKLTLDQKTASWLIDQITPMRVPVSTFKNLHTDNMQGSPKMLAIQSLINKPSTEIPMYLHLDNSSITILTEKLEYLNNHL